MQDFQQYVKLAYSVVLILYWLFTRPLSSIDLHTTIVEKDDIPVNKVIRILLSLVNVFCAIQDFAYRGM